MSLHRVLWILTMVVIPVHVVYCCIESCLSQSDPSGSASYERADPGSIEETGEQTHHENDASGGSNEDEGSEEEYECQIEEL
jgi:hypothetical protein